MKILRTIKILPVLLVTLLSGLSLPLRSQDAAMHGRALLTLMAENRWFEARTYYDRHRNGLDDFTGLYARAQLGLRFNRSAEAASAIETLSSRYPERIAPYLPVFGLFLSQCYAEAGRYAEAAALCETVLDNGTDRLSQAMTVRARQNLNVFRALSGTPPPEIVGKARDAVLKTEIRQGIVLLRLRCNGIETETIFDTGATHNAVDEQTAARLGIRTLADSVLINTSEYCKLGVIDSMELGSIVLRNLPCYILPTGFMVRGEEKTPARFRFGFNAILGMATMKLFPEIRIGIRRRTVAFLRDTPARYPGADMMLIDNAPYLRLSLNGVPAVMKWDTGMKGAPSITERFYTSHASAFPPASDPQKGLVGGTGGIGEVLYRELDAVAYRIPQRKVVFPKTEVLLSAPQNSHALSNLEPYDGILGRCPARVAVITIDFAHMTVRFE